MSHANESMFEIEAIPPFRLDLTAWALRRRSMNSVDRWNDGHYSRVVVFGERAFVVDVQERTRQGGPILRVLIVSHGTISTGVIEKARSVLGRSLGLDVDLGHFYEMAERSARLAPLVDEFRGVKPPRFPTLFEAFINAIVCQQLSLDAAITILNRFAERFGKRYQDAVHVSYSFPRPEDLEGATEDEIKAVGLTRQKARAIRQIARDAEEHDSALAEPDAMSDEKIIEYLTAIKGIGRWSAEYVLLRGLGRLSSFPADDVGARNNLQRLLELKEKPDYDRIKRLTMQWHPYEGLVYFHLLLRGLKEKGAI